MYLKAGLFLAIGVVSVALLLLDHPSLKAAALIGLAVWAFCRVYYFAFYVIERYIDPEYRFAGLWSVVGYLRSRDRRG
jgi:hypothetical protein